MPILQPGPQTLAQAVQRLQQGLCIGLPTETVYGLAADALNPHAVAQIFQIKNRPTFDPLIVHVPFHYDITTIAHPTPISQTLIQHFWPGPLTILLEKTSIIPDLVTAGLSTVAIRCPSHPIAQEVLDSFNKPLAAPSANRFGKITPTTAIDVQQELQESDLLIIDGGHSLIGIESTIVDCTQEHPVILRKGAITLEQIREIFPDTQTSTTNTPTHPTTPGMLPQHYAPGKLLYRSTTPLTQTSIPLPEHYAYLFWQHTPTPLPPHHQILTPENSPTQATLNLFRQMRQLDATDATLIITDPLPHTNGLCAAIDDRLQRASYGLVSWENGQLKLIPKKSTFL